MYWMQKEKITHKPVFKIKSFFFCLNFIAWITSETPIHWLFGGGSAALMQPELARARVLTSHRARYIPNSYFALLKFFKLVIQIVDSV